jgi:hypothetical protein
MLARMIGGARQAAVCRSVGAISRGMRIPVSQPAAAVLGRGVAASPPGALHAHSARAAVRLFSSVLAAVPPASGAFSPPLASGASLWRMRSAAGLVSAELQHACVPADCRCGGGGLRSCNARAIEYMTISPSCRRSSQTYCQVCHQYGMYDWSRSDIGSASRASG